MKILLGKALVFALVTMVLTGCGGSSDDDDDNSNTPSSASVAASSAPSSVVVASSSAPSSVVMASSSVVVEASSAPSSEAASSMMDSSSSEASSAAPAAALVIYEEDILPEWKAWDCCAGSTPAAQDGVGIDNSKAVQFNINGSTVVGFSSRTGHGAVDGAVFDASDIKTTGIIRFDLKMTKAPDAGEVLWKFKVESDGGTEGGATGTAVEINLSESVEGHVTPVLNEWQTYTFNLADLEDSGARLSGLDVFMVFPAWGSPGAIFLIDNVKIWATGAVTPE